MPLVLCLASQLGDHLLDDLCAKVPLGRRPYIPDMKALWMAENVIASLHNIYTFGEALLRFGLEAEVMFASHHWPRWGNERIQEVLRGQRDFYAHMNNQVLHLANQGVTINQIHNVYEVPKGLQNKWYCRAYHGSHEHNSRGFIQRYLGFWDCNLTTLIPLSPGDSAPLYVTNIKGFQAEKTSRSRSIAPTWNRR
jgi:alkyl sulfatase BDS1-like metallo-beta-lactamase superfamily hydrolase